MSVASIIIPHNNEFAIYDHGYDSPALAVNDLAAVRGDGVFETLLIKDGKAIKIDRHIARLCNSARALDIVLPNSHILNTAITNLATQYFQESPDNKEGQLRIAVSRGRETDPHVHCYLMAGPTAVKVPQWRETGISVITLNRGYSVDYARQSPWALLGAKTLSYATNLAAVRYALSQGADDAIYTSSEGWVLESTRGAVVICNDNTFTTTPLDDGILASTTQAILFETANKEGFTTEYRRLSIDDLFSAQSIWIISSITLAAPVHTINSQPTRGINNAHQKELWGLLTKGLQLANTYDNINS